jgi:diguanylate cyclase
LPTSDNPPPIGVVRVGDASDDASCDVLLPREPAPGELRLACRLLAEVVRLRRREEAATRMHDHLRQKALSDPLTGLPNRRAWDEVLTHRAAAAGGAGRDARLCVAVADLDHFKQVNDTEGHAAGDRVLAAAGDSFRAGLRQPDFVARLGGDEFGILLDVPDAATAARILDRLRQALPGQVERAAGLRVTTSIGWRLASPEDDSPETTFTLADTALREAKRAGRDCLRGADTP